MTVQSFLEEGVRSPVKLSLVMASPACSMPSASFSLLCVCVCVCVCVCACVHVESGG